MTLKVLKNINVNTKNPIKSWVLNFTDIVNNNNKCYLLDIIIDDNKYYLYTQYGRLGGSLTQEFRLANTEDIAHKEADKLIKNKIKKGYVEIKLSNHLNKASSISLNESSSKLSPEIQNLIKTLFEITNNFIQSNLDTLKCPLGNLSDDQILVGKDILDSCRKLIQNKSNNLIKLNELTNKYYSNIPFNLGYSRINPDNLRLDSHEKIDKAFDILDVFGDGKNIKNIIDKSNAIDEQYYSLNSDINFIEPNSEIWQFVDDYFHKSRANNHNFLGKLKINNIFEIKRKNEFDIFLKNANIIAESNSQKTNDLTRYYKSRPDIENKLNKLYKNANINLLWHGTRRANMIGIITKGLLIRPSGVQHAGSMFGDGIYWANSSTKSVNYTDIQGSYWAKGNNKSAYLFLADVVCGSQLVAKNPYMFNLNNIKPHHSVLAIGGKSGVINDEIITFQQTGEKQQHHIKYIVEFENL